MNNSDFTIITFYQFKQIDYQEDLKKRLKEFCLFNKIRGTTIIAKEGLNGTLAGLEDSIKKLICLKKNLIRVTLYIPKLGKSLENLRKTLEKPRPLYLIQTIINL